MKCPKCKSDRTERSAHTWVCYDCMHIFMHKKVNASDPVCTVCQVSKTAQFILKLGGAWVLAC